MRLARQLLYALWAGLLATISVLVTPTLFTLPVVPRPLAGQIAAELFRRTTLLSMGIALLLLLIGAGATERPSRFWVLLPAALLALSEFAVRPHLELARAAAGSASAEFARWHQLATILYLAALIAVVVLLVKALRDPR